MDKTLAITGATSGIGKATTDALRSEYRKIILLVRNPEKARSIFGDEKEKFDIVACDLAELASVTKAVKEISRRYDSLDVLINNAGGIFIERHESRDGYELTFAMNHLGHFHLTLGLMPLLKKSGARVINVSSAAHRMAKPDRGDLLSTRSYSGLRAYANAKLFNILFAREIHRRFGEEGVSAYSLHPGVVGTGFGSGLGTVGKAIYKLVKPLMISPEKGAQTSIYLAKAEGLETYSGGYFEKSSLSSPTLPEAPRDLQDWLWQESLNLIRDAEGRQTEVYS